MQLIDSHCHLDFKDFDDDRDKVLSHCQGLGIQQIIVPGVIASSWQKLINICQQSTILYPALGLHPMFMEQHRPEHSIQLNQLIKSHNPIAIGEIGLDFYLDEHDKKAQIELFSKQLLIAKENDLPVILHVRKAHDQTIQLLKQHTVIGGIVHAFNGSEQHAQQYIKLGFLLGVGGVITHQKATRLRQLFSQLPLSSLALETDAPDMPLANMDNQRNTPENIPRILDALSELRPETRAKIAQQTTENVKRRLLL
ncbi:MAG: TatD family hydrolase [Methylophagaceae bacterium]